MPIEITCGPERTIDTEGVRAPHLLRAPCGDLLLDYHVTGDQHFARRACYRSTDNGQSWVQDPQRNHRELAWGKREDGMVLTFDRDTLEMRQGVYLGAYYRSTDGGRTFEGPLETEVHVPGLISTDYPLSPEHYPSEDHPLRRFYVPIPEFYHSMVERASHRTGPSFFRYLLADGDRWITTLQGRGHGDTGQRTVLVESHDDGASWHFVATVGYEHGKMIDGMCEPVLARVADGSLLCVMRRGGHKPLAQARSTDGGRTWSEPELLAGFGVDPDLHLMSNGVLACTYGRPGLYLMFSEDGCGFGWGYHTQIGTWASSAYMGITELEPDRLLLTYDRREPVPSEADRHDPAYSRICARSVQVKRTTL